MYVISSEWLYKWKCFLKNKISKPPNEHIEATISKSKNPKIGILPPGPITNIDLLKNDGIQQDDEYQANQN